MPKHIHGPASPVMWLRPLSALFLIRRSIRCGFGLPIKHRRHFVDSTIIAIIVNITIIVVVATIIVTIVVVAGLVFVLGWGWMDG